MANVYTVRFDGKSKEDEYFNNTKLTELNLVSVTQRFQRNSVNLLLGTNPEGYGVVAVLTVLNLMKA